MSKKERFSVYTLLFFCVSQLDIIGPFWSGVYYVLAWVSLLALCADSIISAVEWYRKRVSS